MQLEQNFGLYKPTAFVVPVIYNTNYFYIIVRGQIKG